MLHGTRALVSVVESTYVRLTFYVAGKFVIETDPLKPVVLRLYVYGDNVVVV